MSLSRFIRVGILLGLFAGIGVVAARRLAARGQWIPEIGTGIGNWQMEEVPISGEELGVLGNPRALGFELSNPLNERIYGRIIAAETYDAYQVPLIIFRGGYVSSAERTLTLGPGSQKALAQIYKQRGSERRLLMVSWRQRRDGSMSLKGVPDRSLRDLSGISSRLALGAEAAFQQNQSCLVRLITLVHPADPDGQQALRNIKEAALALREHLRREGGAR